MHVNRTRGATRLKTLWWLLISLIINIALPWLLYPVLFTVFCPILEGVGSRPEICAGQGPLTLRGGFELALISLGAYAVLLGMAASAKCMPSGKTSRALTVPAVIVAAAYTMLGNAIIDGVYEPLPARFIALCALAQGAAPFLAWVILAPFTTGSRWNQAQ
jgi:hypothetical protein